MKRSLLNLLLVLMWLFSLNLHMSYAEDSQKSSTTPSSEALKVEALLEKARQLRKEQPELFGIAKGVLVIKTVPDSQGENVGLQPGDILLTYDGFPIESNDHLIKLTGNKPESSSVELIYLRNTSQQKASIQGGRIGVQIQSLEPIQSVFLVENVQTLFEQGNVSQNNRDYQLAIKFYDEGLNILQNSTDQYFLWQSYFHNNLGVLHEKLGQYPMAQSHYQRSLEINRELGDLAAEAKILDNLGIVYRLLSQYQLALKNHQQSMVINRKLGDRAGEAWSLNNLGNVYQAISKYPQAKENHEQSLAIYRELNNRGGEAVNLNNLGNVYLVTSEYPQAKEKYQQSLEIFHKLGNRVGEAESLINLGNVYNALSNYTYAQKHYQDSLEIVRELGNHAIEVKCLNNLGLVHQTLSQYPQALDYFQQSLAISRKLGDRSSEATVLSNLGVVYWELSEYSQAQNYYQQSLKIVRKIGNRSGEMTNLLNLGTVHYELEQYQKAIDYSQKSLVISRKLGDRASEARSYHNLGKVYQTVSEYSLSLEHYQQSLTIRQKIGDRAGEAKTLNNMGSLYNALKKHSHALGHYQQSLAVTSQIGVTAIRWVTWNGLADTFSKLKQPDPAIFAGKQAVNNLQGIRTSNTQLEKGLQKSFLENKKYVYRDLSDALIEQGRLAEAEQVMAMLKEEEYFDFIQRDAKEDVRSTRASYTAKEQTMVTEIDKFHTQLTSLGKEYETLVKTRQIDESDKTRLTEVEALLDKAQAEFLDLLSSLDDYFKKSGANKALAHGERQLELLESQQESLENINAVIITTVVTEDKLHLLLTTPKVQLARRSPIGEKDLNSLIKLFREALKDPRKDPLRLAQELYRHLVKPLEEDLKQTQATTLMWSLDGSLRYLPLAALHDGKQYLLERYALSLYTAAAHNNFNENNIDAWSVAGLGVSKEHPGFIALPSVPKELESIVRKDENDKDGVIPGEIRLDKDFTRDSFKATLRKKYPVLHIASHFKLQPGDGNASKLLLGDGDTLTLDEFRRKAAYKLHGVDLMTLSACDTAVGGKTKGGEVESFAVMAQLRGAKGVMATLWKVEDESTGLLMQELYRLRSKDNQLSKAEALRQAQLELLRGNAGTKTDYSHPYFWAPFIMMGNWL